MGKVSLGQGTKHIKASGGPETHHLSHYATTYSNVHAIPEFKPRPNTHSGTGYLANFRPAVYYNESIDKMDNPEILSSIRKNYNTSTKDHFKESRGASGTEPLPPSIYMAGSGFNTGTVNTLPLQREITDVHADTRKNFKPQHRSLLFQLQRKDPVEQENSGEGPRYMKPETASKFAGTASVKMDLEGKTVGRKQASGFINAYNIEPITYRPDESFSNPNTQARPIGESIMRGSFTRHPVLTGTEKANSVSSKGQCVSGFVKGTYTRPQFYAKPKEEYYTKIDDVPPVLLNKVTKSDPAEYANLTNPHNKSSITQIHFKPVTKLPPFEVGEGAKLGRSFTGKKEPSGSVENNDLWLPPKADSPDHYTTYYSYKHQDLNPTGAKREGYMRGSVLNTNNGFTKSTALHRYGNDPDPTNMIRSMNSYQAKSLLKRDNLLLPQQTR